MTLQILAEGLRCPFCFSQRAENQPLSPTGDLTIGCDAGHRFDVNKRGYVSLLPASTRVTGDSQAMLDARARFFETGSFDPIADAVATACCDAADLADGPASAARSGVRLAELGCGTGFYLKAASDALRARLPSVQALAADLSPAAVRTAVRTVPGSVGVVLDVWQPLPLRSSAFDGILSVFAPRNLPEFARVLAPGGFLVAVVPTTRHLQEVRADGLAIGIPDGKPDALTGAASPWFDEITRTDVEFEMTLTSVELGNLIGMGPSAHHRAAAAEDTGAPAPDARTVTASVTVLSYRLR